MKAYQMRLLPDSDDFGHLTKSALFYVVNKGGIKERDILILIKDDQWVAPKSSPDPDCKRLWLEKIPAILKCKELQIERGDVPTFTGVIEEKLLLLENANTEALLLYMHS